MREQVPYLANVATMLGEWAAANPGAEIPRAVGMTDFTVEGVTGQRIAVPFSLWMFQRALDYFASLSGDERTMCEEMLRSIGGDAVIDFDMPKRLNFENFKLTLG